MTATLTFNLPEEEPEFRLACNGIRWMSAMHDLDQHLRSLLKYDDTITGEAHDALDKVREKLYEILQENSLSFNE